MHPLIVFDRVSYRYEGVEGISIPALDDISLEVEEGEFVAIVGANGSGKSTFARLAGALLIPQSGDVRIAGIDTRQAERRSRIHALIGMVFQFPEDQIVSTTVEEDVAFGPENLGLPPDDIRARVGGALEEVGLWEERRRSPHSLSAGQTQRLALAGVLAMRPRCIIFDEASTMLDPEGRRTLLEAMQRLHREGVTVLFITHFMEEAALADRVIVFHRGRLALDGPPEEVFADPARLAALRLDQPPAARLANAFRAAAVDLGLPPMPDGLLTLPALFEAIPPFPVSSLPLEEDQPGGDSLEIGQASPLIEVEGLGYTYMRGTPLAQRALREASLRVAAGEVHGLMGQTGSGKSTLLQHLNGLLRPQEGRVRVAAFNMNDPSVVRREVVRTVGMVFQNPEAQFFEHYVGDEIAFGPEQLIGKSPQAALEVSARVRWAMEQVGLDFVEFKDRPLFTLSGGERRKVALASTLALRPEILLLDEPTAGLDPHSRIDLIEKMALMRDAGMTLVLSSHQMGDMARLAQSVTVFHRGNDVLSGATADVFAQLDSLLDVGLDAPVGAKTAAVMRSKGWMVPDSIIALDDLASWIVEIGRRNAGE